MSIAINKKSNSVKSAKREVATLLSQGQEEKARIKVEPIIRDDYTIEAYEVLSLITELLSERAAYIDSQSECPSDLVEAVSTILYVADRIDIAELGEVKKQLKLKYGRAFAARAQNNEGGCCNDRVVTKLTSQPPSPFLVQSYLQEIASQYQVDWVPVEQPMVAADVAAGAFQLSTGFSAPSGPGAGNSQRQRLVVEPASAPIIGAPVEPPPSFGLAGILPTPKPGSVLNGILPTVKGSGKHQDGISSHTPLAAMSPSPGPIKTLPFEETSRQAYQPIPGQPTYQPHTQFQPFLPNPSGPPPPYSKNDPFSRKAEEKNEHLENNVQDSPEELDTFAQLQARFAALQKPGGN